MMPVHAAGGLTVLTSLTGTCQLVQAMAFVCEMHWS